LRTAPGTLPEPSPVLCSETGASPSLTPRHRECLHRIARGETTLEIAKALGLSRHTVDHYIATACDRLRAKTRAHAVAKAFAQKLIPELPVDAA
jgi:DNA-binding CsgD family transcriptional regulator